jgi:hypothetical protein
VGWYHKTSWWDEHVEPNLRMFSDFVLLTWNFEPLAPVAG